MNTRTMSLARSLTLAQIARHYQVSVDGRSSIALSAGRSSLPHLCRALGLLRGAEVGVWKGAYSEEFCRTVPGLQWACVDPWAPYADYREAKNDQVLIEQAYREAQAKLSRYPITWLRMSSREAAAQVPDGSLDLVYIDGNHEAPFVREDLELWTPKLRSGGILAGHDYRVPPPSKAFIQVKDAVDRYVRERDITPLFVLAGDKTPSFFWVVE